MKHVSWNHVILTWVFSVSQNRIRSVTPKIWRKALKNYEGTFMKLHKNNSRCLIYWIFNSFVMLRDLLGHRFDEYLPILYTSEIINEFFACVRNWYQFFTCVRNWYQFFTPEKKSHQFFTGVTNTYQFFTRQKLSTWEIWAQILDPKIYRNWPYVNFTFGKCDELVPILLMGVKFTKWEIYGSTMLY